MAFFHWSKTAGSNGNSDPTVNYQEGQAPSSLNDSARAVMARLREWGSDIAGAIVTGGTSTAYTVTSNQVFDTLAHLDGAVIAFTPHTTNGATVTLNVDSLGAKPLRSAPSVELQTGALVQGTPYICIYNNTDGVFYLHGNAGFNSYSIPLAGGMVYFASTAPNSAFAFPYGQAISRTTYATLFSLIGTTYGSGDGSTTFNIPDLRGRVPAGLDNMGGSAASRLTSIGSGTTLGASGGEQAHTLSATEIPSHTHSGTTGSESNDHTHQISRNPNTSGTGANSLFAGQSDGNPSLPLTTGGASQSHTHSFTTDGGTGGGGSHNNVQPTILVNYIIRVI